MLNLNVRASTSEFKRSGRHPFNGAIGPSPMNSFNFLLFENKVRVSKEGVVMKAFITARAAATELSKDACPQYTASRVLTISRMFRVGQRRQPRGNQCAFLNAAYIEVAGVNAITNGPAFRLAGISRHRAINPLWLVLAATR